MAKRSNFTIKKKYHVKIFYMCFWNHEMDNPTHTCIYVHTYIYNWPLQFFSQDYGLASHTTHVVCVNFIRKWRQLQFVVDSERKILKKAFHGNFIYFHSFCQKSDKRKSPKKYFCFHISFWCLIWDTNLGLTSIISQLYTRLRKIAVKIVYFCSYNC